MDMVTLVQLCTQYSRHMLLEIPMSYVQYIVQVQCGYSSKSCTHKVQRMRDCRSVERAVCSLLLYPAVYLSRRRVQLYSTCLLCSARALLAVDHSTTQRPHRPVEGSCHLDLRATQTEAACLLFYLVVEGSDQRHPPLDPMSGAHG